jgi:hypothetical protein
MGSRVVGMRVCEVAEQRELPGVCQETRTDTGRLAPMPLQDRLCVESEYLAGLSWRLPPQAQHYKRLLVLFAER